MKKELSNNTNRNKLKGILTVRNEMATRGITLVALVVTIVVLLILAGITISYIMGDNSVFKKASDAKVQTELGKIEERANLIYVDKLIQNVPDSLNNKPTMEEIVGQLKTEGYKIEKVAVEGSKIIGISLDKESMSLGLGTSNTIKVTLEESNAPSYYAFVDNKYYKMNFNNGNITIDRTPSSISGGEENTLTLKVESSDATVATATIDNITNIVTITAKSEGTTTITVSLTDENSQSTTCTVTVVPPKVADIVDKVQDTNVTAKDENGNKITIPGGFKVVPDTEENDVDYPYSGDKKPCVQDGIVIEDAEGNQFVWIPVGEIKNKDGSITTITLGRYTFNTSNGTPTLQQNANNYTQVVIIEGYYQELTSNSGNTAAKNLGDFITKTKANGGYYLGRYEASKGSDDKVKSQADKAAWTAITQPNAAIQARGMYSSTYVESDLINSYSWDTAIIFIQKYSGNSNYANKNSVNNSSVGKLNTGKAGDKVCNIHDMASNCAEWSTEHSTLTNYPCVCRGSSYHGSSGITFSHGSDATTDHFTFYSFRPLCYIK